MREPAKGPAAKAKATEREPIQAEKSKKFKSQSNLKLNVLNY